MADTTLDQALPAVQDLAGRKANAFVRRCGFSPDEREDVRSQFLLSFLLRWPKFDAGRASVRTFASRVMDKELTSMLRHRLAPSRREQECPHPPQTVSAAARTQFRIDVDRAIAPLPAAIQETALALFWCSTLEATMSWNLMASAMSRVTRGIRGNGVGRGAAGPRAFSIPFARPLCRTGIITST